MTEQATFQFFACGRIVATPGAMEKLSPEDMIAALERHGRGDWGDVDAEDKEANDMALLDGGRLLSVYPLSGDSTEKFWIITEADRSATTVLLPEEY